MREHAQELKAEARRGTHAKKDKADGQSDVLTNIAEMPEPDRGMAKQLHAIVKASARPLAENLVWDARVCQERRRSSASSKARRSSDEVLHISMRRFPAARHGGADFQARYVDRRKAELTRNSEQI